MDKKNKYIIQELERTILEITELNHSILTLKSVILASETDNKYLKTSFENVIEIINNDYFLTKQNLINSKVKCFGKTLSKFAEK